MDTKIDLSLSSQQVAAIFSSLPFEILLKITMHLSNEDLTNLVGAIIELNEQFNPVFLDREVQKLLQYVADGDQHHAEKMLEQNPSLMVFKSRVTARSKHEFKYISPFQLTLWTLDTYYMAGMMLDCLESLEAPEALELVKKLLSQFDEVMNQGITYDLEGHTKTDKHFDFDPLIQSLQDFRAGLAAFERGDISYNDMTGLLIDGVGPKQQRLPAHAVQHYCDPNIAFDPIPTFRAAKFNRSVHVYNWNNRSVQSYWQTQESQEILKENFVVVRGLMTQACGGNGEPPAIALVAPKLDAVALSALYKTRQVDCLKIKEYLEQILTDLQQQTTSSSLCTWVPFNETAIKNSLEQITPILNGLLGKYRSMYDQYGSHVLLEAFEDLVSQTETILGIDKGQAAPTISSSIKTRICLYDDLYKTMLPQVLALVAEREVSAARSLLKQIPQLMLYKSCITNSDGLTFHDISPFQLALWKSKEFIDCANCDLVVFDNYSAGLILGLMLACLDGLKPKEKLYLIINLLEQHHEVQVQGVSYTLSGKFFTESHQGKSISRVQSKDSNTEPPVEIAAPQPALSAEIQEPTAVSSSPDGFYAQGNRFLNELRQQREARQSSSNATPP